MVVQLCVLLAIAHAQVFTQQPTFDQPILLDQSFGTDAFQTGYVLQQSAPLTTQFGAASLQQPLLQQPGALQGRTNFRATRVVPAQGRYVAQLQQEKAQERREERQARMEPQPLTPSTGFRNRYAPLSREDQMENPFNQYEIETLLQDQPQITPVGSEFNPNTAAGYAARLYRHGLALANRVMVALGNDDFVDGPITLPFGVWVPKGYQPSTLMDGVWHKMMFKVGRCYSPAYFARKFGADKPQDQAGMKKCIAKELNSVLFSNLEHYVALEADSVLDYINTHPGLPFRQFATYANVLGSHTPAEFRAALQLPIAVYALGEDLIAQAKRVAFNPSVKFSPNFDALLATPRAFTHWAFPAGFKVKGTEDAFNNLLVRYMLCRSGGLVSFRGLDADDLVEPRARCIEEQTDAWWGDEWTRGYGNAITADFKKFMRPEAKDFVHAVDVQAETAIAPAQPKASEPAAYPEGQNFCVTGGVVTLLGSPSASNFFG
jgi:hypothetical protein